MIYLLLVLIIITIIVTLIGFLDSMITDNKASTVIGVTSFILCVIFMIAFFCIQYKFDNIKYTLETTPCATEYISALHDNSEINGRISGSRYAVRGYFNEEMYYSYMVKLSDGGLIYNKIPAKSTNVYEVDNNYRVEWYIKHKSYFGLKDEKIVYKLYVPIGSIVDDYTINLK